MDTQEVVETIKMWNEFYRESNENNKNMHDVELKKWQENMLKIVSIINIPESLRFTPAEKNLKTVIELARTGDERKLEEIYNLLSEVENYFNDAFV